jgi:hypothetical protein
MVRFIQTEVQRTSLSFAALLGVERCFLHDHCQGMEKSSMNLFQTQFKRTRLSAA